MKVTVQQGTPASNAGSETTPTAQPRRLDATRCERRNALSLPNAPSPLRAPKPGEPAGGELELALLTSGRHPNPERVLGIHDIAKNGRTVKVGRAVLPDAVSANIVILGPYGTPDQFRRIPMQRIHDLDLFEAELPVACQAFKHHFEVMESDGFVRKEEPKSAEAQATALSLRLFNQGELRHVSNLLGANPAEIRGERGFMFRVWAPNAREVSLIGEVVGPDGDPRPMERLGHTGVFEVFVPGATAGQKYQFRVTQSHGGVVEKADPCAKFAELRPGKASITVGESTHVWTDDAWMTERTKSNPLEKPASIYECHLPSWRRRKGDGFTNYRDAGEQLARYLPRLGFTHVELIGLAEHPFDGSWGYQVTGYFAPTSRHGTPDDFKQFVNRLHDAGIGVIYDWVPAHFPRDPHGLATFDGTHLYDHEDPRQGEHKDWQTQIPNYDRHEVRAFLIGGLDHMLRTYHLDGVRLDAVASMLYKDYSRNPGEWVPNRYGGNHNLEAIDFLKAANKHVHDNYPGVLSIAEESTAFDGVTRRTGLGFDAKWGMGWMNDTLDWFKSPYRGGDALDRLTGVYNWTHSEAHIAALSHDEVVHGKGSLLGKMPGDDWQKFANLRLLLSYQWAFPGQKLLMMGSEFGQPSEWNSEGSLDWALVKERKHLGIARLVHDLNRLYKNERAMIENQFKTEGFESVSADKNNAVVAFLRKGCGPDGALLFVHNGTANVHEHYTIGVNWPGRYREVMNSDARRYGGSGVRNDELSSREQPMHGRPYAIDIRVPPLATIALKFEPRMDPLADSRRLTAVEPISPGRSSASAPSDEEPARTPRERPAWPTPTDDVDHQERSQPPAGLRRRTPSGASAW